MPFVIIEVNRCNVCMFYNPHVMFVCFIIHSPSTDERLPDLMWCREPFMEMLNEIEDIDK